MLPLPLKRTSFEASQHHALRNLLMLSFLATALPQPPLLIFPLIKKPKTQQLLKLVLFFLQWKGEEEKGKIYESYYEQPYFHHS